MGSDEGDMVISLNYCSQNGGNFYRAPYYNGNPNIGPRIIGNTHIGVFSQNFMEGLAEKLPCFHGEEKQASCA